MLCLIGSASCGQQGPSGLSTPNIDHDAGRAQEHEQRADAPARSACGAAVLEQDVGCPNCGYNLRGLGGGDVVCPECGLGSNIARLLTRRWDQPWWRAPGYNKMSVPAAWAFISLLASMCVISGVVDSYGDLRGLMIFVLVMLTIVGGWVGLMAWTWRTMGGIVGAAYAMLAHACLVGYALGILFFVGGLVRLVASISDTFGVSPSDYVLATLALVGGLGLILMSRWFEKLIAAYCIKLYLNRAPTTIS